MAGATSDASAFLLVIGFFLLCSLFQQALGAPLNCDNVRDIGGVFKIKSGAGDAKVYSKADVPAELWDGLPRDADGAYVAMAFHTPLERKHMFYAQLDMKLGEDMTQTCTHNSAVLVNDVQGWVHVNVVGTTNCSWAKIQTKGYANHTDTTTGMRIMIVLNMTQLLPECALVFINRTPFAISFQQPDFMGLVDPITSIVFPHRISTEQDVVCFSQARVIRDLPDTPGTVSVPHKSERECSVTMVQNDNAVLHRVKKETYDFAVFDANDIDVRRVDAPDEQEHYMCFTVQPKNAVLNMFSQCGGEPAAIHVARENFYEWFVAELTNFEGYRQLNDYLHESLVHVIRYHWKGPMQLYLALSHPNLMDADFEVDKFVTGVSVLAIACAFVSVMLGDYKRYSDSKAAQPSDSASVSATNVSARPPRSPRASPKHGSESSPDPAGETGYTGEDEDCSETLSPAGPPPSRASVERRQRTRYATGDELAQMNVASTLSRRHLNAAKVLVRHRPASDSGSDAERLSDYG